MMVNGPLDIYGVVLGVKMFDQMFNILASMGIIFLPLLVIFFSNITTPYESQLGNAASTSLRRVAIQFCLWVFTVMLFVALTWGLVTNNIVYQPLCGGANTVPSKFEDTGSQFDQTFHAAFHQMDFSTLKLPIMLAFVLDGMSGFTNAAVSSLGCGLNLTAIASTIDTTALTPAVASQAQQFFHQCYEPAKAKFYSSPPDVSSYSQTLKDAGGQSDLSWIGSHVFQKLYYANIYPTSPVNNKAFSQDLYPGTSSNHTLPNPDPNQTQGGYPSCETWWSDGINGLEAKIYGLVSSNDIAAQNHHVGRLPFKDLVTDVMDVMGDSVTEPDVTMQDVVVHNLLKMKTGELGFGGDYTGWVKDNSGASTLGSYFSNVTSYFDQKFHEGEQAVGRIQTKQEIPIIRAILLAFGLTLGPLIMMIGMATGRGMQVIFTYYFLMGSLLFMTFIEAFVHELETTLEMSQTVSTYALQHNTALYNLFSNLYFYAPMLYLALMSIAGVGLGSAVGSAFDNGSSGSGGAGAVAKLSALVSKAI